jgi:Metalloenzyme superfamily/Type I phosphodiesterase / nucleotide pyrophosphatase
MRLARGVAHRAAALHEHWQRWLGPVLVALALLGGAARCGLRSVEEADELLASINIRAPRLAALPSAAAPAATPATPAATPAATPSAPFSFAPLSRRVVLLVIDGLGEAHSHALPVLDELRRLGVSTVATSHLPSLSRPNYVSLLTGAPPAHSGVRSNAYGWEVPLDSLLHRVRATARQTAFVTDVAPGFGAMFAHQLSEAVATPWSGGWVRAGLLALERRYPLVVIIPGGVDNAGHERGAASDEYRAAALQIDRQLGELLGALDLTRDTIVVTADHGHTAAGGHGGDEPEVMRVPLVMAGAGVRRGATIEGARLVDVAPTVAALLGTAPPRHALGRCLGEALAMPPSQRRALRLADDARLAAIERWLAAEPGASDQPEAERPLLDRAFASAALALLLLFVVRVAERQRLVHIDRRVLAVAVGAPLAAVAALLAGAGGELSLSTLANRAEGTRALLLAAAAVVAVHTLGALWALRDRPLRQRLAATNALVLIALSLATSMVSVTAALLGSPPWQSLPPAPMLLLMPLASMSLATSALGCGLALAIELVVFAARRP